MKLYYKLFISIFVIPLLFFKMIHGQSGVDFLTFNIWQEGTNVPNGFNKIRDVIIEADPDIVGFSEVKNSNGQDWTTKIVNALAQSGYTYYGKYAGGDVSIISKYPIISYSPASTGTGSVAKFTININEKILVVGCAHLDYTYYACYLPRGYNGGYPNWNMIDDGSGNPDPVTDVSSILSYNLQSTRDEQLAAFFNSIEDTTQPIILMGDFNEPSYLDWIDETGSMFDHNGLTIPWQNTITITDEGFTDAYREYFPDVVKNPGITWPSYASGVGSTSWAPKSDERDRIDYVFYKGQGIKTTYAALVGPKKSYVNNVPDTSLTAFENFIAEDLPWPSDHKAVFVSLNFSLWNSISDNIDKRLFVFDQSPDSGIIKIKFKRIHKNIGIVISNISGETVYNKKCKDKQLLEISTREFANGVYFLNVKADNYQGSQKFLINN